MRKMIFLALAIALATLPCAGSRAESSADKAIAQQIGARLKESGELSNYRIGVKYQDGVAWLSGSVTSFEQRDAAMRIARQTDGVTHVVCRLETPNQASGGDLHGALQQAELSRSNGATTPVRQAIGRAPGNAMAQARATSSGMQSGRNLAPRRTISRGNMPLPAQRIAMNPAIRQASAQGVQQAGIHGARGTMGRAMNAGGPMGAPMGGSAMNAGGAGVGMDGGAVPVGFMHGGGGPSYDNAQMPGYAWPSYASYPNYGALTYPRQYSPTAWPYIGPFYPYPQVPLGWRKVTLEWDDGWWFLDFSHAGDSH